MADELGYKGRIDLESPQHSSVGDIGWIKDGNENDAAEQEEEGIGDFIPEDAFDTTLQDGSVELGDDENHDDKKGVDGTYEQERPNVVIR